MTVNSLRWRVDDNKAFSIIPLEKVTLTVSIGWEDDGISLNRRDLLDRFGSSSDVESVLATPGEDHAPAGWFVKILCNGSAVGFYRLDYDESFTIQEITAAMSVAEVVNVFCDIVGLARNYKAQGYYD